MDNPIRKPRILEDTSKPALVETKKSRRMLTGFPFARNDNIAPSTADNAVVAIVAASVAGRLSKGAPPSSLASTATVKETDHEKVFRLVRERKFVEAAKLAVRLINAGDREGFFIHTGPTYSAADGWFRTRLAMGRQNTATGVETISPERAQVLLGKNDGNRKVKAANLANLLNDIASGRWELNGETLIVSDDGLLNDGQHRNYAVLLTGVSIATVMAFGVSRSSVTTVNTGDRRGDGDRLHFHGVPNYSRVAAIAVLALKIIEKRAATSSEKIAFVDRYSELLRTAARSTNGLPKGSSFAAFGCALLLLSLAGADEASILDFFAEVKGTNLPKRKKSPGLKLREALLERAFVGAAERQVYTIIDLFIKWVGGKTADIKMIDELPISLPSMGN